MLKQFLVCLTLLCWLAGPAQAEESIPQLEQEINAFIQGPDYLFAPDTIARAQAYLGAAMLPDIQENPTEVQTRLASARKTLTEANRLARDFRSKYAGLLESRSKAEANSNKDGLAAAEAELKIAIRYIEAGQLNISPQHIDNARGAYLQLAEAAVQQHAEQQRVELPTLLEQTRKAIVMASAANAKKYAPQLFAEAKRAKEDLRAYVDKLTSEPPKHPNRGLQLAIQAREIALQVKQWRKKQGSHEQLVLQAKKDRLRVAQAMGEPVDTEDFLSDISANELVEKVNAAMKETEQERKLLKGEIAGLKEEHASALKRQKTLLENQFSEQQRNQAEKQDALVSDLKESFRVKLERETYEKRRQERIRKLFGKDEVEIFANLDGSLLIRLKGLKFAPGTRSVNKKYHSLLSKLKDALDVYAERKVSVEGHTDNDGDVQKNQILSLRRAEAVRDFLASGGTDPVRLKAIGHGEVRPIASNEFEKGRAINRRIDVIIAVPND